MGAFKRIHPLRPAPPPLCNEVAARSMLFAIHACVNGPSSSLAVPFFKKEHVARQCASAAPHGNLPCGAALAHWRSLDSNRMGAHTAMCAGGVPVLLSILLLLLLLTSATEGVEMFYASGGLCVFLAPWPLPVLGTTHVRCAVASSISAIFDVPQANSLIKTVSFRSREPNMKWTTEIQREVIGLGLWVSQTIKHPNGDMLRDW